MDGKKNNGNIGVIIVLVIAIVLGVVSCGGGSSSKYDVAHDPDGFMGYSDSFWEWYAENN